MVVFVLLLVLLIQYIYRIVKLCVIPLATKIHNTIIINTIDNSWLDCWLT